MSVASNWLKKQPPASPRERGAGLFLSPRFRGGPHTSAFEKIHAGDIQSVIVLESRIPKLATQTRKLTVKTLRLHESGSLDPCFKLSAAPPSPAQENRPPALSLPPRPLTAEGGLFTPAFCMFTPRLFLLTFLSMSHNFFLAPETVNRV